MAPLDGADRTCLSRSANTVLMARLSTESFSMAGAVCVDVIDVTGYQSGIP